MAPLLIQKAYRLIYAGKPAGPWRLDQRECRLDALDQGMAHRERYENGSLGGIYTDIFVSFESANADDVDVAPSRSAAPT